MHHYSIVTIIYDFYKADLRSRSERIIQVRPKAYNVPPVTKIGGEIDDRTTATDVSIITITTEIPVATKAYTTSTKISTTRVTRSNTSISSQDIRYTRKLTFKSIMSTRAKR